MKVPPRGSAENAVGLAVDQEALERRIFAALHYPGCLDFLGNLYSFSADGSIRFTPPSPSGGSERFLAMSSPNDVHAYLATSEYLYALLNRQKPYRVGPRPGFLPRPKTLLKHAPAFCIDGKGRSYFLRSSARDGTRCFLIIDDGVYDASIDVPLAAFAGWTEGNTLVLIGAVLHAGLSRPALAIIDVEGKTHIVERHTEETPANDREDSFGAVGRWHAALFGAESRILIGVDLAPSATQPPETRDIATWHDSTAVSFYSFVDSRLRLLHRLPGYAYAQIIDRRSSAFAYLIDLRVRPGPRLRDVKVQVLDKGRKPSIEDLAPVVVDGLGPDRILLHLSLAWHPHNGFFGIVSLLNDASSVGAHAVTSEDGIRWRVVAELY